MENPFDFFEKIWCINLDKRTDRWQLAQEEFEKMGILEKVERFSAIQHNDGRMGIIKSNLAIVKDAKEKGYNNVLVFEDDVQFIESKETTYDVLNKAIEQIQQKPAIKWSLFYLGANTNDNNKLIKFKDRPNLIYLKNSYAVHAMCYSKSIYDKFIKYAEKVNAITKFNDILDVWIAQEVQSILTCLMVNTMLCTQRNSFSDIEKHNVNYDFIVERFKKNIQ